MSNNVRYKRYYGSNTICCLCLMTHRLQDGRVEVVMENMTERFGHLAREVLSLTLSIISLLLLLFSIPLILIFFYRLGCASRGCRCRGLKESAE
jgi:hypothetical protein